MVETNSSDPKNDGSPEAQERITAAFAGWEQQTGKPARVEPVTPESQDTTTPVRVSEREVFRPFLQLAINGGEHPLVS